MCVYLRTKFQVSRIILTSFRQRVILPPPPTPALPQIRVTKDEKSLLCKGLRALPPTKIDYIDFLKQCELLYMIFLSFTKLKDCFKLWGQSLIAFARLELLPVFYTAILKYIKQSLTRTRNFELFYQQYKDLHIC